MGLALCLSERLRTSQHRNVDHDRFMIGMLGGQPFYDPYKARLARGCEIGQILEHL